MIQKVRDGIEWWPQEVVIVVQVPVLTVSE